MALARKSGPFDRATCEELWRRCWGRCFPDPDRGARGCSSPEVFIRKSGWSTSIGAGWFSQPVKAPGSAFCASSSVSAEDLPVLEVVSAPARIARRERS